MAQRAIEAEVLETLRTDVLEAELARRQESRARGACPYCSRALGSEPVCRATSQHAAVSEPRRNPLDFDVRDVAADLSQETIDGLRAHVAELEECQEINRQALLRAEGDVRSLTKRAEAAERELAAK